MGSYKQLSWHVIAVFHTVEMNSKISENYVNGNRSLVQLTNQMKLHFRGLSSIPGSVHYFKKIFWLKIHHFIKLKIMYKSCAVLAPQFRYSNPWRKIPSWVSTSGPHCNSFCYVIVWENHSLKIAQQLDNFIMLLLHQAQIVAR